MVHFCAPGSGSGSTDPINPDPQPCLCGQHAAGEADSQLLPGGQRAGQGAYLTYKSHPLLVILLCTVIKQQLELAEST